LELKDIILHHPRLEAVIQRRARAGGQEIWKIRQEADRYLDEIAADYNYTLIQFGAKILSWLWNNLFDGIEIDTESLQKVKKAARNKTLIYIPCHKSHMDYLILSYLLFKNSLYPPFIAAGKNLSFWPLGPIFRRGGAFFIRRTFKGNKFYAEIFSLYVKTMVQLGHNIEFFIEGGRSRTGKMVLPKLGLMAILIQAVEEEFCEDLVFVPTSICYDRIPEEEAYVKEITGGSKVDENIKQLVNARRFLKKRYGRVYVQFAEPVSLQRYLQRRHIDLATVPSKMRHAMYRDFSYRIIHDINEASLMTPHALVAASLLSSSRLGISKAEFHGICSTFYDYLVARGIKLSKTLRSYDSIIEDALRNLERSKLVGKLKDEDDNLEEEVFTVDDNKRLTLEYYKNNIIHFLLPAAFVSTSILAQQTFRFSLSQMLEDIAFLKDFFKYEFVYDNDLSDEKLIWGVLEAFEKMGWLHPLDNDEDQPFLLAHKGLKAADSFHGLIRNYFEGYWLVLRAFRYLQKKSYPEKDFLKKVLDLGEKTLKLELIERSESISKILFGNALKYYVEKGVVGKTVGDEKSKDKVVETYSDVGDRYLIQYYSKQISHFLRSPRFTLQ
jgi:glycerol-3-phosphate O-acyltransferase